jgi:hypothetical protein
VGVQFAGFGGNIKLPVKEMIEKLVVTVLLPLALGKVVSASQSACVRARARGCERRRMEERAWGVLGLLARRHARACATGKACT